MIPKIIHCFWAQGPKTKLAERCLASWRKYAPDWEIREWTLGENGGLEVLRFGSLDEKRGGGLEVLRFGSLDANFNPPNIQTSKHPTLQTSKLPNFVRDAVAARKWAMVSDWARMRALEEFGGIYLDLDVELVKPIGELPDGEWVAGEWAASGGVWMNPGSGIALEKGSPIARMMLERYDRLAFDPKREMMPWINGSLCDSGLCVLPPEVMSPIGVDGKLHRTERTVGIHWYAMSWASPKRKLAKWLSWHGMRPVIDAMLWVRNWVRGLEV